MLLETGCQSLKGRSYLVLFEISVRRAHAVLVGYTCFVWELHQVGIHVHL